MYFSFSASYRREFLILWSFVSLISCQKSVEHKYSYFENFQESPVGELPDYWLQTYGHESWLVDHEGSNKFLTQKSLENDSIQVYLHLFDRNPIFKGQFRFSKNGNEGHFSILLRYNADGAWTRINYFPDSDTFKLVEQEDVGRPVLTLDEYELNLADGWHDFLVEADSSSISFSLDNKKILSTTSAKHITFGKLGFETYKTLLQVDNLDYAGNQGRPNPGVVQGEIRIPYGEDKINSSGRPFWGLHLGVLHQRDSSLLGVVGFRDHESRDAKEGPPPFALIRSYDNGLNWTNLALKDRIWAKDEGGEYIRGVWPNLTKVKNDWVLMGYKSKTGYNTSHVSYDDGNSWQTKGALKVTDELKQIHTGHHWQLNMMTMPGKLSYNAFGLYYPTTRVLWHSNSDAENWKPIYVFHPENKTWNPPSQEHQIVQVSDSVLAVYARDDGARENWPESQTLVKRWSSDSGKSWTDYKRDNSQFISSKCAFSVKQDPYTGQTWMFWTYNDKDDEPSANNQPRTRMGLAVSHDSTKTWQYIMDVDDWGYPSRDSTALSDSLPRYLTKDNRFTNLALWVGPEYLHLTARRRFRHGKENIEDFCIFYTRLDKEKIIPYPEFPGTRY